MQNSTLDLITNSPNLQSSINENIIIEHIVKKIQSIPQYQKLQKSIDIILYLCNAIETLTSELRLKKQKGFKKDLAIEIFERLGWSTPPDKEFLINAIEHLHSTNRIEKVKVSTKAKHYLSNFFLKIMKIN